MWYEIGITPGSGYEPARQYGALDATPTPTPPIPLPYIPEDIESLLSKLTKWLFVIGAYVGSYGAVMFLQQVRRIGEEVVMPDIGLKGTIAWIVPLVITAVGFDMIPGGWITAFSVFVIYGFSVYLVADWWENRA